MKVCKDCGIEFVRTGRNHIRCSACKIVEEKRKQRIYERKLDYRKKYGITLEQYNAMFANQNGCCLICNKHQKVLEKGLAVDHCHTTGKVRGLLCSNCNLMLGLAKDKTEILSNAIRYLNTIAKDKNGQ
jgi:hypothetical protein